MVPDFGFVFKNLCLTQSYISLILFFSWSVIVLGFTFGSLIHFDLIFVYRQGRNQSYYYFLCMHICLCQHCFLKRLFFCLCSIDKSQLMIYVRVYLWNLFSPIYLYVYTFINTTVYWLLYLCNKFWNQVVWIFQLYSFFKILAILFPLLSI